MRTSAVWGRSCGNLGRQDNVRRLFRTEQAALYLRAAGGSLLPRQRDRGGADHVGPLHPARRGGGLGDRTGGDGQDPAVSAVGRAVPALLPGGDAQQRPAEHPPGLVPGDPLRVGTAVPRDGRGGTPLGRDRLPDGRRRQLAGDGAVGGRGAHLAVAAAGGNPPLEQPRPERSAAGAAGAGRRAGVGGAAGQPEARLVQSAAQRPVLSRGLQPRRDSGLHPIADQLGGRTRGPGFPGGDVPEPCFRPPAAWCG